MQPTYTKYLFKSAVGNTQHIDCKSWFMFKFVHASRNVCCATSVHNSRMSPTKYESATSLFFEKWSECALYKWRDWHWHNVQVSLSPPQARNGPDKNRAWAGWRAAVHFSVGGSTLETLDTLFVRRLHKHASASGQNYTCISFTIDQLTCWKGRWFFKLLKVAQFS